MTHRIVCGIVYRVTTVLKNEKSSNEKFEAIQNKYVIWSSIPDLTTASVSQFSTEIQRTLTLNIGMELRYWLLLKSDPSIHQIKTFFLGIHPNSIQHLIFHLSQKRNWHKYNKTLFGLGLYRQKQFVTFKCFMYGFW